MKKSDLSKLGVLLIVLSFICMGGGFVVTYVEKSYVFTPPDSVLGQTDGITISTVDGDGPDGLTSSTDSTGETKDTTSKDDDKDTEKDTGKDTGKDKDKSSSTGTGSSSGTTSGGSGSTTTGTITETPAESGGTVVSGGGGGSTTETPEPEPEPTPEPVTPTIDETNNSLRQSIQNTYGITVKYGSEVSGYSVGGMSTTIISDPYVVQNALNSVQSTIGLYPLNIWREISNSGFPLTIYLIQRYSTSNVTGVTQSFNNGAIISIAMDFSFGETFNHEVFHYFENFITYWKGASWDTWNSYNPSGFTYGSVNSSLSYSRTYSADSYFVNDYAQTQAAEDRASTFEYMMFTNKASCLNNSKPVWNKAKYMANQLDTYLNSVSPYVTEYWERHL